MRYAASLLYGGMLVDSQGAGYEDYKRLLLRCPECGKEVHLVAAKHRGEYARLAPKSKQIVIVREHSVVACFAHFDGIENEKCQNSITQTDHAALEKRQASSRGQRLRLFQRRFWQLVSTGAQFTPEPEVVHWFCQVIKLIEPGTDYKGKKLLDGLADFFADRFPSGKEYFPQLARDLIVNARTDPATGFTFTPKHQNPSQSEREAELERMVNWICGLELDLHLAVVSEAIDYLCIRSARPILKGLFLQALYQWHDDLVLRGEITQKEFAQKLKFDVETVITQACGLTVSALCLVPWADLLMDQSKA